MINKGLLPLFVFLSFLNPINGWLSCFHCPTSDDYDPACVDAIMPPWPICLFHSVDYWVENAIDSESRCCGDDISECKCPHKDTAKFKERIEAYCEGVQKCKSSRELFHSNANPFDSLKME